MSSFAPPHPCVYGISTQKEGFTIPTLFRIPIPVFLALKAIKCNCQPLRCPYGRTENRFQSQSHHPRPLFSEIAARWVFTIFLTVQCFQAEMFSSRCLQKESCCCYQKRKSPYLLLTQLLDIFSGPYYTQRVHIHLYLHGN